MNLNFNLELAKDYTNNSQRARILSENWVKENIICPACGKEKLSQYEANLPVADFFCPHCQLDFELKSKVSKNGELGHIINDGAYDTMIARITSLNNPCFFFLTYYNNQVNNLVLIPNHFFIPDIIIKRKPLSARARRAGWIGCNIDISKIPHSGKIVIIESGQEVNQEKIMTNYSQIEGLRLDSLESRGWLIDVLTCIDRIPDNSFSLGQLYEFESFLKQKHPDNNFIKEKIRQQLQYLRDKGLLKFTTRGYYQKMD